MTCQKCRDEIETLKEQITQLREVLGATDDFNTYGLTDGEWQLVGPLFRKMETSQQPVMTHDQMRSIYAARYSANDGLTDSTMKALISRARHKLKPLGYEIQPRHGQGYELVRRETV